MQDADTKLRVEQEIAAIDKLNGNTFHSIMFDLVCKEMERLSKVDNSEFFINYFQAKIATLLIMEKPENRDWRVLL